MVLEVHLHDLVGETEHYGMPGSHPFLHVYHIFNLAFRKLVRVHLRVTSLWLLTSLKVAPEVL